MSLYTEITKLPRDPIIGLTELFNTDKRKIKYNLGVGVYLDEDGKVPVLESVKKATQLLHEKKTLAFICLWVAWIHFAKLQKNCYLGLHIHATPT